ncbi:unnamed protein product, partial [Arabidopsis halleri]
SLRRISSLLKSGPFTSSPQVGTISSQLNLFKGLAARGRVLKTVPAAGGVQWSRKNVSKASSLSSNTT